MKYFKKILASGLAAMAAVSAMSMTALAAEELPADAIANYTDESAIQPMSYPISRTSLTNNGTYTSSDIIVSQNSTEKYLKVWVENYSYTLGENKAEDYTVRLYRDGNLVDTCTVSRGEDYNGSRLHNDNGIVTRGEDAVAGTYYVTVSNKSGNPLKGYITVRRESYAQTLGNNQDVEE